MVPLLHVPVAVNWAVPGLSNSSRSLPRLRCTTDLYHRISAVFGGTRAFAGARLAPCAVASGCPTVDKTRTVVCLRVGGALVVVDRSGAGRHEEQGGEVGAEASGHEAIRARDRRSIAHRCSKSTV